MMMTRAGRFTGVAFVVFLTIAFFLGNQRPVSAQAGDIPTDPLPSECSDGIDNDGDGLVDFVPLFGDSGCDSIFDSTEGDGSGGGSPVPSVTECSDGIDNDGDGRIDFVPILGDPDCDSISDSSEAASHDGGNDGGNGGGDGGSGGDNAGGNGGGDNTGGGNSGGPAPACEDSIDNDGDSLVDMNDPGCDSPGDNDESSGGSGGGGGTSGGGVSSGTSSVATTTGEVLGVATTTETVIACDTYLTSFIRFGVKNDPAQVSRLQKVLRDFEGAAIEESGEYDSATLQAVHAFQKKYADEILKPWGIAKSTGYVYLTTRKKINEIRCENKAVFPLTEEEQKTMEEVKKGSTAARAVVAPASVPAPSAEKKGKEETSEEEKIAPTPKPTSSTAPVQESGLKKVWDLLGRLFNRGR